MQVIAEWLEEAQQVVNLISPEQILKPVGREGLKKIA